MTDSPIYAKRDDSGEYTVDGIKYPSVTTVLGIHTPEHLMFWSAKMAAMKCILPLVQSGILTMADLIVTDRFGNVKPDEKLIEFVEDHVQRSLSKKEALQELRDWRMNMKEFERYRDFKARVGSLTHHAFYEHAVRGRRPASDADLYDWLCGEAINLKLCHWVDEDGAFHDPTPDMLEQTVNPAIAYVHSAWEWIETAKPDFKQIGLECVIVREQFDIVIGDTVITFPGYAGTQDFEATFKKKDYGYDWLWEGEDSVDNMGDVKTSNALPDTVKEQTTAYDESDWIVHMNDDGTSAEKIKKERNQFISCLHVGPHAKWSDLSTEFGELQSKATQLGSKLYSWRKDPVVYASFLGKCASWHASKHDSESLKPATTPKPVALKRTDKRPNPFAESQ